MDRTGGRHNAELIHILASRRDGVLAATAQGMTTRLGLRREWQAGWNGIEGVGSEWSIDFVAAGRAGKRK